MKGFLYTAIIILTLGCGQGRETSSLKFDDGQNVGAGPPPQTALRFDVIRDQIMIPKCMGCHDWAPFEDLFKKKVKAGNPDASKLFLMVERGSMPEFADPLNAVELELIRAYILAMQ